MQANPRDLLTLVDGEVQTVIQDRVRARFPAHGFLGEESVAAGAAASASALDGILSGDGTCDWNWIVDPIDGTINFVEGIPLSAISIGVAFRGEPVRENSFHPCFIAVPCTRTTLSAPLLW